MDDSYCSRSIYSTIWVAVSTFLVYTAEIWDWSLDRSQIEERHETVYKFLKHYSKKVGINGHNNSAFAFVIRPISTVLDIIMESMLLSVTDAFNLHTDSYLDKELVDVDRESRMMVACCQFYIYLEPLRATNQAANGMSTNATTSNTELDGDLMASVRELIPEQFTKEVVEEATKRDIVKGSQLIVGEVPLSSCNVPKNATILKVKTRHDMGLLRYIVSPKESGATREAALKLLESGVLDLPTNTTKGEANKNDGAAHWTLKSILGITTSSSSSGQRSSILSDAKAAVSGTPFHRLALLVQALSFLYTVYERWENNVSISPVEAISIFYAVLMLRRAATHLLGMTYSIRKPLLIHLTPHTIHRISSSDMSAPRPQRRGKNPDTTMTLFSRYWRLCSVIAFDYLVAWILLPILLVNYGVQDSNKCGLTSRPMPYLCFIFVVILTGLQMCSPKKPWNDFCSSFRLLAMVATFSSALYFTITHWHECSYDQYVTI